MTITMIITIVAIIVFGGFCVLCIKGLSDNRKDIKETGAKIENIEKNVGSVGEIVAQKTDMIARRLDVQESRQIEIEQQVRMLAEQVAMSRQAVSDVQESAAPSSEEFSGIEDIDDEIDLDELLAELQETEPVKQEQAKSRQTSSISEPQPMPQPQPVQLTVPQPAPIMSEAPQPQPQPVQQPQPAQPQQPAEENIQDDYKGYIGYNIGKSGKRYTPAELNSLIKE